MIIWAPIIYTTIENHFFMINNVHYICDKINKKLIHWAYYAFKKIFHTVELSL